MPDLHALEVFSEGLAPLLRAILPEVKGIAGVLHRQAWSRETIRLVRRCPKMNSSSGTWSDSGRCLAMCSVAIMVSKAPK